MQLTRRNQGILLDTNNVISRDYFKEILSLHKVKAVKNNYIAAAWWTVMKHRVALVAPELLSVHSVQLAIVLNVNPNVYFIVVHCLIPDNFTCQGRALMLNGLHFDPFYYFTLSNTRWFYILVKAEHWCLTVQVAMRPEAPYFVILLCPMADDFTRQEKSVATQWVNQTICSECTL